MGWLLTSLEAEWDRAFLPVPIAAHTLQVKGDSFHVLESQVNANHGGLFGDRQELVNSSAKVHVGEEYYTVFLQGVPQAAVKQFCTKCVTH